ncbi:MAG: DnaJ domain-containing protein [Candidatus Limnocylindrales bacterium]
MADPIDAYKILQVDPEAEDEVIRAAYRRLARKYHPDLAAGPDAGRMAAINTAWSLVGTPAARSAYDRARTGAVDPGRTGGAHTQRPPARAPDMGRSGAGADHVHGGHQPPPGQRPPGAERPATAQPRPETVSRDWTSGRSTVGGGFNSSMRSPDGLGAAGPPPGRPSGSVLNFGRYNGWSLGEIARKDLEYIEWLDRTPIGRTYRDEVDAILRVAGRRQSASTDATERRGLFRRR